MNIANKEERGTGGKRCIRKSVSLTNDLNSKAKKLAVSCDLSQAELLSIIIELNLNSVSVIDFLQTKYNKDDQYRLIPIEINGKLHY